MKTPLQHFGFTIVLLVIGFVHLRAQNPIINTQFTADPSARVFGNRVYLFPSHDIPATEGRGRAGWFVMEDYHVYSSADLTNWTDHGMIVTQNKVPWVRPNSFSMWAPDCIERNGKYYFYFPTSPKDTVAYGRGFTIGVAVADKPEGPYIPEPEPIKGIRGIDPNVFIDKDGQAYIYWSQGNIYGAKLKANMLELDGPVVTLQDLPTKGLKEGPYVIERNGLYYLTYPHVENKTERLEYAIGNNPLGPFKITGVIMDESPTGCWTNHHSIIRFNKQYYLFYHHNDYSPGFDKLRSTRIDSLFFNDDGTIQKVKPTLRGVGITKANSKIQIDRYSAVADNGISIDFLDTLNRFAGWKATFNQPTAWLQYNTVDFGQKEAKKINVHYTAAVGTTIEIRLNNTSGTLLGVIQLLPNNNWSTATFTLRQAAKNIQNLVLIQKGSGHAAIDWISFE